MHGQEQEVFPPCPGKTPRMLLVDRCRDGDGQGIQRRAQECYSMMDLGLQLQVLVELCFHLTFSLRQWYLKVEAYHRYDVPQTRGGTLAMRAVVELHRLLSITGPLGCMISHRAHS